MVSGEPSGKRNFQLYLLDSMRGADRKVDEAIDFLGVTREQMQEVGEEIGDRLNLLKFRRTIENVKNIMGEPEWEEDVRLDQEYGSALNYALPVWPEFYFRILGRPDGLWVDGGFVRREDSSIPLVENPAQLEPWECLRSEIEGRFGPLQEGDLWYPYEDYTAECRGEGEALRHYYVQFSWQLLQRVSEI